ncbi:MAG: hypothetical protein IKK66_02800 [Ruminococcus sp.]|nr:hypothetical protein [Ruminococcus sp.]
MTTNELNALKFYIGDVSGNDFFYGDSKAYVVLNSLFFPDITSEKLRAAEGKYLNPAIIEDIPRLMDFFDNLFSLFGKAYLGNPCITYRVERMSDFELCRNLGRTVSMTSTSLLGFLDSYRDRRGIALMKFNLAEGTKCVNVAEILDYYAKPEESEILIPPFMSISIRENCLTDKEKRITDCDNNPPYISVEVSVEDICHGVGCTNGDISDSKAGIRVLRALNESITPDSEDIAEYSAWKKNLLCELYKLFLKYF